MSLDMMSNYLLFILHFPAQQPFQQSGNTLIKGRVSGEHINLIYFATGSPGGVHFRWEWR